MAAVLTMLAAGMLPLDGLEGTPRAGARSRADAHRPGTTGPMSIENTNQPALEVHGVTVPKLGFGTWQITGDACHEAVTHALDLGYRHIDTARAYENEAEVGRAIEESSVDRGDVFLTTKLWITEFAADDLRAATEDSLRKLRVDHVDLLLLHWPNPDVPLEETLEALDGVREAGLTRLIGVSNFPAGMLRRALELAPIATDQVEFHPFLGQDRLLEVAEQEDVFVTAYSPLAHGKVGDDATLREIGDAHGKTAGQVALRYLLELDRVAVLPKSATASRREENFDVLDFELTPEDRRRIEELPKDQREIDPGSLAPDWDA